MNKIQLLYIENKITRKKHEALQCLVFFMRVENLGFDKEVAIIWAGEDGQWHTLKARFHSRIDQQYEYWIAEYECPITAEQSIPGNILFSLRFQFDGQTYWDNNKAQNYCSQADSGVRLLSGQIIQNVAFDSTLTRQQRTCEITVAVQKQLQADKVIIQWSVDNWQTSEQSECRLKVNYWDKKFKSNARNPNQYETQIWTTRIQTGDAFCCQYSICCEINGQQHWDNNFGANYTLQHDPLSILVLNLHCYQEDDQDKKLSQIAKAIDAEAIDIICFQEVAENWNDGQGDWETNSANIINQRLSEPYQIDKAWSHLGFDRYREGVAVLSRFPFLTREERYVSESDNPYSIHSRKVLMTQIDVPFIGKLNVFSAHLSWLEDGFKQQFQQLSAWANDVTQKDVSATLLCGDFNITAGSVGYSMVVEQNQFHDQFLAANNKGLFDKIFRVNDRHWQDLLADDYRIDYIFMNKNNALKVVSAKVLFTEQDYGRVSDHCGYLMTFEPNT